MISGSTRKDLIRISLIWVVLSAVGELLAAYGIAKYPGTASSQGLVTSEAFFFLLRVAVPILILVMLIIGYSAYRFRVPDDDVTPSDNQYRTYRAFPWTWVTISTVLNVLFIFHPGISGLESLWSLSASASNPMEIDVTAKQWEWQFDYPAQHLKGEGDLVVPVNVPIHFVMHSEDVIHSFWVPAWGIKKAVIPGETRVLDVTPDRIIDTKTDPMARVQCSQICGVGHADMQSSLRVVSASDFKTWVDTTLKTEQEAASSMNMNMPGMGGGAMKMPGMKMQDNSKSGGGMHKNGGSMSIPDNVPGMDMKGGTMPAPDAAGDKGMSKNPSAMNGMAPMDSKTPTTGSSPMKSMDQMNMGSPPAPSAASDSSSGDIPSSAAPAMKMQMQDGATPATGMDGKTPMPAPASGGGN